MSDLEWKGVSEEHSTAWRCIFNLPRSNEGMYLSSACPVCGSNALYRYYALGRFQPIEIDGVKYKGPGSYWEWCSGCRSFEHMSGFVPEWWNVELINIENSKLTAIPDALDEAINKS